MEPPDPLPNSEVKRSLADGSVGSPHVRVGHRQAFNTNPRPEMVWGFFMGGKNLPFARSRRCYLLWEATLWATGST